MSMADAYRASATPVAVFDDARPADCPPFAEERATMPRSLFASKRIEDLTEADKRGALSLIQGMFPKKDLRWCPCCRLRGEPLLVFSGTRLAYASEDWSNNSAIHKRGLVFTCPYCHSEATYYV